MDVLFTTEDVLLFVSETMQTTESFENLDHDFFLKNQDYYSFVLEAVADFKHPRFASIPFWTNFSIRASIWCITIVLNVLVIRFYSKEKGSTRSNILALSYADVIFAAFSVFASLVQLLFLNNLAFNIIDMTQFLIEVVFLNNYLNPSLFLAVDRFVAVAFPHKVLDLSRKIRPIKWLFFALNVLVVSSMLLVKLVFFGPKVVDLVSTLATFSLLGLQLFGTFALYTTIVVLLIRSNKTLGQVTQG